MREYAKVAPQFWTGKTGRQIRKMGHEYVTVAMYLMTCQSANMIGLYYLPLALLAHETGLAYEAATRGPGGGQEGATRGPEGPRLGARNVLAALEEIGFCVYDDDSELVWVVEMAKYQIGDALSPKDDTKIKGVANILQLLPFTRLTELFVGRYGRGHRLTEDLLTEGARRGPLGRLLAATWGPAGEVSSEQGEVSSEKNPPSPLSAEDLRQLELERARLIRAIDGLLAAAIFPELDSDLRQHRSGVEASVSLVEVCSWSPAPLCPNDGRFDEFFRIVEESKAWAAEQGSRLHRYAA